MKITEQAAIELKKVLANVDTPGAGVHIFNAPGCCGPSIQMDVATEAAINEIVVSLEGIDFYVEKDLIESLSPVTIDYGTNGFRMDGLERKGGCCG